MSERLKIAFVVHDFNRHIGHSRYVAELATRFKRDHEVHVFANTFDESDVSNLILHRVPCWRPNALASIMSFILPATLMVRGNFDIVHAQGLSGLRHNITTAHIILPEWHAGFLQSAGRLSWKQRIASLVITPFERRAFIRQGTRHVIAISERVRQDLATHYDRHKNVTVVYHGVDLDTFHPRNRAKWNDEIRSGLNVRLDEVLAIYVGDLQKGAAAAIKAVSRVPDVILALVSGSESSAERELVDRLGLGKRIRFVPFSREVQRYFAAADIFVFPTIYEAFGMVITEAMASGVPPLTSRRAGASELVTHGESGWLTDEPWNVDQIAAGLAKLSADSDLRKSMGIRARAAIEPYTWDRTAAETMSIYRQIAAERRRTY